MTQPMKFDRFKIEWIVAGDISAHPRVQRPFNKAHGEKIAAEFDPDKFMPLLVVPDQRRDGKYWVFGGQHRHYGALHALGADQRIPCHVFEDAPIEKLAAVCKAIDQGALAWRTLDKWAIRILAREEVPLKVEAILKRNGLHVEKSKGPGVVQAVSACESIFLKTGNDAVLEKTVKALRAAYGDDPDGYDKTLILGLGHVMQLFDGQIESADLAQKLAKHSGPARLVGQARDTAKSEGISVHRAAAVRILRIYNSGRRSGRLTLS